MSDLPWFQLVTAAALGNLPGIAVRQSAASVASLFGGRQPIYLATPYSRDCTDVLGAWSREESDRMERRAAMAAAELLAVGVTALSPIVQAVRMVNATGIYRHHRAGVAFEPTIDPLDAAMWVRWCQPLLNVCGAMVVPDIPGWDQSAGVWGEVQFAVARQIPVFIYGGP
jgi:hypothetical protein